MWCEFIMELVAFVSLYVSKVSSVCNFNILTGRVLNPYRNSAFSSMFSQFLPLLEGTRTYVQAVFHINKLQETHGLREDRVPSRGCILFYATRAWVRPCLHTVLESSVQRTHGQNTWAYSKPCEHIVWCHTGWVHVRVPDRVDYNVLGNSSTVSYTSWTHGRGLGYASYRG